MSEYGIKNYSFGTYAGYALLVCAILTVTLLFGKKILQTITSSIGQLRAQNNLSSAIDDLDASQGQTISGYRATELANKIYRAVKGTGTDEAAIYAAFNSIKTTGDVYAIVSAFGVKDNMTLSEWLYDDLSNGEINKINKILTAKGITYQF